MPATTGTARKTLQNKFPHFANQNKSALSGPTLVPQHVFYVTPACQSVQFLGRGSYNHTCKLVFDDVTQIAASVPVDGDERFNTQA
jgi:hypothetical protein